MMLDAVHMGRRTVCVGGAGARSGAQGLSRDNTTRGSGEKGIEHSSARRGTCVDSMHEDMILMCG